jgi:hypothetical protein
MPTEFSYEHVFRAPAAQVVLAAYFDPDHLAAQDALAGLIDRTVIDANEDEAVRTCSWRVTVAQVLPIYARPFVSGGRLRYVEAMVWRKADDQIDVTITPEILGGRVHIASRYELSDLGPQQVRRRYRGTVTANIKLLSAKIERGILAEIDRGIAMMTDCTQRWLQGAYPT